MLIICKTKTTVINLDKTICLGVSSLPDKAVAVKAYFDIESQKGITLGSYETAERAKQILQEIVGQAKRWEDLKAGQPSGICSFVYSMPEE